MSKDWISLVNISLTVILKADSNVLYVNFAALLSICNFNVSFWNLSIVWVLVLTSSVERYYVLLTGNNNTFYSMESFPRDWSKITIQSLQLFNTRVTLYFVLLTQYYCLRFLLTDLRGLIASANHFITSSDSGGFGLYVQGEAKGIHSINHKKSTFERVENITFHRAAK